MDDTITVLTQFLRTRTQTAKERRIFCLAVYVWILCDLPFKTALWYSNVLFGTSRITTRKPAQEELQQLFLTFVDEVDPSQLLYGCKVGSGTYGSVLQVLYNNERYALKTQKLGQVTSFGTNPAVTELAMLVLLQHTNIVSCKGFLYDGFDLSLLLDYYPYTLEQKIQEEKIITKELQQKVMKRETFLLPFMSVAMREKITLQLYEAINYMHNKDVLHLDLKPNNVLVDYNYNVKIIDFGLCSFSYHKRQLPFCALEITPPEYTKTLIAEVKLTQKIDYWQLGLILLEMEICVPVFWTRSMNELKRQQRHVTKTEFVIGCNQTLIKDLMEINPLKRRF